MTIKIIATVCFIFQFLAFLIAYESPAGGYEYSFYSDTPILTWIFLFFSLFGGIAILVYQALAPGEEGSKLWIISIPILALATMGILLLPSIRDYYSISGGDPLTHLGVIKDMLSTNSVSDENYYPISHILVTQLADICRISAKTAALWGTPAICISFVLSTYLLSSVVFSQPTPRLLATAIAGAIITVNGLTPNGWSMFFIPLILFSYLKRDEEAEYRWLLIILLLLYPFFHPLSATMVAFSLVVIELTRAILRRLKTRNTGINFNAKMLRGSFAPILIIGAIMIPWLLSFNRFAPNIRNIWEQITGGITPDVTGQMSSRLGKVDVHGIDFMVMLFKMYGVHLIVIALSGITLYILSLQIYRRNLNKELGGLFLISTLFLSIGSLYFLYIAGVPGLGSIGGERIIRYVLITGPVLCGYAIYKLSFEKQGFRNRIIMLSSTGIILLIAVLSTLSLYPSPYVIYPNPQITHMDVAGMKWLAESRNSIIEGRFFLNDIQHRLATLVMGKIEYVESKNMVRSAEIKAHFGYPNYDTLGQQYERDIYTGYTQMQKDAYTTVWKIVGRFNDADFRHLDQDPSVDKIYTNGESNYYHVSTYDPARSAF